MSKKMNMEKLLERQARVSSESDTIYTVERSQIISQSKRA